MTWTPFHRFPTVVSTGALALALATASLAQASPWTLRLQAQGSYSSESLFLGGDGDEIGISPGAFLGLEYRLNDLVGIELGVAHSRIDQEETVDLTDGLPLPPPLPFRFDFRAETEVTPVTAGVNFHLTPNRRADLYIGPRIGWAFFDDLEFRLRETTPGGSSDLFANSVALQDSFVYGVRFGFDLPLGERWLFSSSLDYQKIELEPDLEGVDGGPGLDLDPLSLGLGVAYRF